MKASTAAHIGNQIRRRRVVLHISQEALGAQLGGITQQAISKMERGGEVSGSQLLELSRILNVPVSYFFDGLESGLGDSLDDATAEGYSASGMVRGARYG